ncbi:extracellular solute-binding protein [Martelella alba]|uniref:Extracellular solute-binding protein n=1 Tax=Martelella alba TaxID=2590451 RepID=A0A506UIZ4_9HYPH|nr:extracellular solute-binding protein [Martelella alba]TPW33268.1 extracellular solute-binding protein [Martelella alba]
MTFRRIILTSVATVALAGAASAEDLTIVSWGGAYSASQDKAYHQPYMAEHPDVNIINDESSNEAVAKLRAMSEAGNVTWDLVDVEGPDSQRLCDEGLAQEIDLNDWAAAAPDGTTATVDFGDAVINDCFIPQIVFSTTFGYRTDVAEWNGKEPTSLCDIFDTTTFPGKRALEKRPKKNIEWALICDGVAKEDLYDVMSTPEGIDRALKKLGTIKDDVIWWSAGAETPQLLADGEIVMGSTYNGRLYSVIVEDKQPVKMLWDWQVFDYDGWIVPAGLSEEKEAAVKQYINFATDTQRLADQAKYIAYGPARASSQPLVTAEMKPYMPTNPDNMGNYLVNNIEWWADNQDDVEQKFQAWLAQ